MGDGGADGGGHDGLDRGATAQLAVGGAGLARPGATAAAQRERQPMCDGGGTTALRRRGVGRRRRRCGVGGGGGKRID